MKAGCSGASTFASCAPVATRAWRSVGADRVERGHRDPGRADELLGHRGPDHDAARRPVGQRRRPDHHQLAGEVVGGRRRVMGRVAHRSAVHHGTPSIGRGPDALVAGDEVGARGERRAARPDAGGRDQRALLQRDGLEVAAAVAGRLEADPLGLRREVVRRLHVAGGPGLPALHGVVGVDGQAGAEIARGDGRRSWRQGPRSPGRRAPDGTAGQGGAGAGWTQRRATGEAARVFSGGVGTSLRSMRCAG